MHVRDEPVNPHFQKHHEGSAHVLPHLWIIIHSQGKQVLCKRERSAAGGPLSLFLSTWSLVTHLNESVDVVHQRLGPVHDELVHTGNGMRPRSQGGLDDTRTLHLPTHSKTTLLWDITYRILGLQCLKNCRNLGIMMLRGLLRASLSKSSEESSQIFCRAPKAP